MKKILAMILVLAMALALVGCASTADGDSQMTPSASPAEPSPSETPSAAPSPSPSADFSGVSLNVGFLKGPTGIGAAYMMEQAANGELAIDYNITLEADPSVVTSALISGELDMAAVPTNVACTLYNKTNGNVKIVAVNTLGVLYILEKGESISSVADLAGKTIYATGQGSNPEYVLNYILTQNGLEPGVDVTIEYMASDELATKMAAGEIDICMLPVPAATTVLMKNSEVRTALSLADAWEAVSADGSVLTQGCIVARTDKVDGAAIAQFLKEYGESVGFMADEANLDEAAALAVKYEIVGSEAIAAKAIPDCNQVFIAGADAMKEILAGYYDVLFAADPTSIGGAVPNDDFYFEAAEN